MDKESENSQVLEEIKDLNADLMQPNPDLPLEQVGVKDDCFTQDALNEDSDIIPIKLTDTETEDDELNLLEEEKSTDQVDGAAEAGVTVQTSTAQGNGTVKAGTEVQTTTAQVNDQTNGDSKMKDVVEEENAQNEHSEDQSEKDTADWIQQGDTDLNADDDFLDLNEGSDMLNEPIHASVKQVGGTESSQREDIGENEASIPKEQNTTTEIYNKTIQGDTSDNGMTQVGSKNEVSEPEDHLAKDASNDLEVDEGQISTNLDQSDEKLLDLNEQEKEEVAMETEPEVIGEVAGMETGAEDSSSGNGDNNVMETDVTPSQALPKEVTAESSEIQEEMRNENIDKDVEMSETEADVSMVTENNQDNENILASQGEESTKGDATEESGIKIMQVESMVDMSMIGQEETEKNDNTSDTVTTETESSEKPENVDETLNVQVPTEQKVVEKPESVDDTSNGQAPTELAVSDKNESVDDTSNGQAPTEQAVSDKNESVDDTSVGQVPTEQEVSDKNESVEDISKAKDDSEKSKNKADTSTNQQEDSEKGENDKTKTTEKQDDASSGKTDKDENKTKVQDVKKTEEAEKTDDDDVQIVEKPKEEIQVIDLDDSDSEDVKKEVKTNGLPVMKKAEPTELKKVAPQLKQEVKPDTKQAAKSKIQTCIVCKKVGKCKYNIVRNGDIKHLCDDDCFKKFRSNPTSYLRTDPVETVKVPTPTTTNKQGQLKTCAVCQIMNINAQSSKPFLNWQGMDFCGEECLGNFQSGLNSSCASCLKPITQQMKGKFCVRFGTQIRQFCSQNCNTDFMKKQKVCSCCQKDITYNKDAFVAPVGSDSSFKDFCSQRCLQMYEEKNSQNNEAGGTDNKRGGVPPKGIHKCSVCSKTSTMKHALLLEGKQNYLCGDPCFSAFQYANKLTMNTCDNCGVYCYNEGMNPQYIQFEGQQKRFCSFMCVNTFKTLNKKIVSCSWCNCKKSNFDMIERVDANNKYQLFCSLNCLSLYRVNLQATSNQAVTCDHCKRNVPAQYHLTMSDASVRNFCCYNCVMSFQAQFTGSTPVTQSGKDNTVRPKPGIQTRSTNRPPPPPPKAQTAVRAPVPRPVVQNRPTNPNMNQIPIISNVVSLAPQGNQPQQVNFTSNQQIPLVINNKNANIRTAAPPQQQTQSTQMVQTVIIQPPQPKTIKNKSCLCKPFVQTKATSCRPHTQTKETQTDKDKEPQSVLVPVPIPFYVPVPMAMYTQPTPTAVPFPIPIPIPCFIPTTKKGANSILKHIMEIREKIPDDPLEAELLMMAEAVSAEPKQSSDSESDHDDVDTMEEDKVVTALTPPSASPEPEEKSTELAEDMLQMALRMATDISTEPIMDLEETIAPVPVNAERPAAKPQSEEKEEEEAEDNDGDEDYTPVRETRSNKNQGTKRTRTGHSRKRSKKHKAPVIKMVESPAPEPEPEPVVETPADANFYLKYTYGVNAWKHWVVLKNSQLEKVSKQGSGKLKLFKTDMLQCSADELNYSLCLFVKEVRKPNGEEYAPDSIYYLCLGIQMFLFESDRIDNIFTDVYYEKFTECLNEVLQRFTPMLNAAGQIVCRIEEEHLWECKQLGAHSPHVLLNTLVYFNTKYFQLKTSEDHLKLSFTHIMKHWKKTNVSKSNPNGRNVYLRYYCPASNRNAVDNKKRKEDLPVFEQAENLDNPLRCPVKLYEFYLSKCPESIKNRSDAFYLIPERSCVPDSPVWYSTQNLQIEAMNKMLNRTFLVREIQESFIHAQPIYT